VIGVEAAEKDFEDQKAQAREVERLVAATNAKSEKEFLEQNPDKPFLAGFSPFINSVIEGRQGEADALQQAAKIAQDFAENKIGTPEEMADRYEDLIAQYAAQNNDNPDRRVGFVDTLEKSRVENIRAAGQFVGEQRLKDAQESVGNVARGALENAIATGDFDAAAQAVAETIELGNIIGPGDVLGGERAGLLALDALLAQDKYVEYGDEWVESLIKAGVFKSPEGIASAEKAQARAEARAQRIQDDDLARRNQQRLDDAFAYKNAVDEHFRVNGPNAPLTPELIRRGQNVPDSTGIAARSSENTKKLSGSGFEATPDQRFHVQGLLFEGTPDALQRAQDYMTSQGIIDNTLSSRIITAKGAGTSARSRRIRSNLLRDQSENGLQEVNWPAEPTDRIALTDLLFEDTLEAARILEAENPELDEAVVDRRAEREVRERWNERAKRDTEEVKAFDPALDAAATPEQMEKRFRWEEAELDRLTKENQAAVKAQEESATLLPRDLTLDPGVDPHALLTARRERDMKEVHTTLGALLAMRRRHSRTDAAIRRLKFIRLLDQDEGAANFRGVWSEPQSDEIEETRQ
jgi:hypothetical protein